MDLAFQNINDVIKQISYLFKTDGVIVQSATKTNYKKEILELHPLFYSITN